MTATYGTDMLHVEVRMPTFKRPKLLNRALRSLIEQTHANWICRVFDDCPDQSALEVCAAFSDPRIKYEPNPTNLGICANIDKCFSTEALEPTAFICLLEDDNFFLSSHLSDSVDILQRTGLDVLVRNHFIEPHDASEEARLVPSSGRTMYGDSYADGVISPIKLRSVFFYSIGATNAGLFWRKSANLDFSTLKYTNDPVIQERLRTLRIDRPVYWAMEPTVVWRDNGPKTYRGKTTGKSSFRQIIEYAFFERRIYSSLYQYLKKQGATALIFDPPNGAFDSGRERVFWRVGISVPKAVRTISFRDLNC